MGKGHMLCISKLNKKPERHVGNYTCFIVQLMIQSVITMLRHITKNLSNYVFLKRNMVCCPLQY